MILSAPVQAQGEKSLSILCRRATQRDALFQQGCNTQNERWARSFLSLLLLRLNISYASVGGSSRAVADVDALELEAPALLGKAIEVPARTRGLGRGRGGALIDIPVSATIEGGREV